MERINQVGKLLLNLVRSMEVGKLNWYEKGERSTGLTVNDQKMDSPKDSKWTVVKSKMNG